MSNVINIKNREPLGDPEPDDDIDEWQDAYERAIDGLGPYPDTLPGWRERIGSS